MQWFYIQWFICTYRECLASDLLTVRFSWQWVSIQIIIIQWVSIQRIIVQWVSTQWKVVQWVFIKWFVVQWVTIQVNSGAVRFYTVISGTVRFHPVIYGTVSLYFNDLWYSTFLSSSSTFPSSSLVVQWVSIQRFMVQWVSIQWFIYPVIYINFVLPGDFLQHALHHAQIVRHRYRAYWPGYRQALVVHLYKQIPQFLQHFVRASVLR